MPLGEVPCLVVEDNRNVGFDRGDVDGRRDERRERRSAGGGEGTGGAVEDGAEVEAAGMTWRQVRVG